MRKYIVAGNWKMNKDNREAEDFIRSLLPALQVIHPVNIVLCPPFTALATTSALVRNTAIAVGGQNMYFATNGAFTGEISGAMLVSAGCQHVILGHSERRHIFGEADDLIRQKVDAALTVGLHPIICVGETLAERQAGQTEAVVRRQYSAAFAEVSDTQIGNCVIAYEPVWAIGTGVNATPAQASEAHAFLRELIRQQYGDAVAKTITILYGGSVKAANATELIRAADIDGFLIGGASLVAPEFVRIAEIVNEFILQKE